MNRVRMGSTRLLSPRPSCRAHRSVGVGALVALALGVLAPIAIPAQPTVVDLAALSTAQPGFERVYGSVGDGARGTPVAGGPDCDGDGHRDLAMASLQASPLGRTGAGEVYLVFGTGAIIGTVDTAGFRADVLKIAGGGPSEVAGAEIWIDDVTGDGIGDLLIGRQNYSPSGSRIGAGALTILVGGTALRTAAATLQYFDLAAPPAGVTVVTVVGANSLDRLGIWMRTGDVTGDGIADIAVGADQAQNGTETHAGVVYVIRGGSHLASPQTIDLAGFGTTALPGHITRLLPPAGASHYHFGATCQIADVDGNGRGDVLVAAALQRAGAAIIAAGAPVGSAHPIGGASKGALFIAWDDVFATEPWPAAFTATLAPGPSTSRIAGGIRNRAFGEEILAGLDYDVDGVLDLFVGDIIGDASAAQNRTNAGSGHVLYNAPLLKGQSVSLDALPPGVGLTTIIGAGTGDIAADTALHGDFDGDGFADLAIGSPHGDPPSRPEAGMVHVFYGQRGRWPAEIDLLPGNFPAPSAVRATELRGARGTVGADHGDILCYSAASADVDGDGTVDLIVNEMLGNGATPAAIDTGNLIVIGGDRTRPAGVVGGGVRYHGTNRPVDGVITTLTGTPSFGTRSDGLGDYRLYEPASGARQLVPAKADPSRNGVSALDASYVLQSVVDLRDLDAMQALAGDVSGNGTLTAFDAALILQYVVELLPRFPAGTACQSDWVFTPMPGPAVNQTVVPPALLNGVCQPGAIAFSPLVTPVAQQDFDAIRFGDVTGNWAP